MPYLLCWDASGKSYHRMHLAEWLEDALCIEVWVYASKNLNILNHSGAKANNGMTWIGPLRNYSSAITELVFKKLLISIKQEILFLNLNKSIALAPRWFPFLILELISKVINPIISTGKMMIDDPSNNDPQGTLVIWSILAITYSIQSIPSMRLTAAEIAHMTHIHWLRQL